MNLVAIIPVENLQAARATLEAGGFGPGNFGVAMFAGTTGRATHALTASVRDEAFHLAVKALPGVVWSEFAETASALDAVTTLRIANSLAWITQATDLPASGNVLAQSVWRYGRELWRVISQHNRTTFGGDPAQYPALIRRLRTPAPAPWVQPLDQFDAYLLVEPFTGQPERSTVAGALWQTRRNLNSFAPGIADGGWFEVSASPRPWLHVGNEGYPSVNPVTGGPMRVTHNGVTWRNPTDGTFWEPGVAVWINEG